MFCEILDALAKVMPRVFFYILLCTKRLDKNEKLSVEQTRVLTVVHYPRFLLSVYFDYEPSYDEKGHSPPGMFSHKYDNNVRLT